MTHEKFDENLDSMIAEAKRVGAMEYRLKILSDLHEIDKACAEIGSVLMDIHVPEHVGSRFNAGWEKLKRYLHNIEQNGGEQ